MMTIITDPLVQLLHLSAMLDLMTVSCFSGLSSSAIVASQQASAPSTYPPTRR